MSTNLGFQTDAKYGIPRDLSKEIHRCANGQRPVMALVINPDEDPGGLEFLTSHSGVLPIGRCWWPGKPEPDKKFMYQGAAGALPFWQMLAPRAAKCPQINLWTSPNEVAIDAGSGHPQSTINAKASSAFLGELFHIFEEQGLTCVGGNFGTGHLYLYLWEYYMGLNWSSHLLGLHAYGMRTMRHDYALNKWHLLRPEAIAAQWDYKGVPFPRTIITETGIDWAGNPNQDGWQKCREHWDGTNWSGGSLSADQYLMDGLVKYDEWGRVVVPEIIGILPFIARHPYWPGFEFTEELLRKYADYIERNNQGRQPLPQDEPIMEVPLLMDKLRWWMEEEQRNRESGLSARAEDIRLGNITLAYRMERALKAGRPLA